MRILLYCCRLSELTRAPVCRERVRSHSTQIVRGTRIKKCRNNHTAVVQPKCLANLRLQISTEYPLDRHSSVTVEKKIANNIILWILETRYRHTNYYFMIDFEIRRGLGRKKIRC